ncbi:MAG: lamin tail domain-containing protein [Verrucomicrobia bacterium]|nr:lamin tail domain-containing protein [Verrucomicrobiota bacterium]
MHMLKWLGEKIYWLALMPAMLSSASAATLVSSNSTWKFFKGTTEASAPDSTAWRKTAFDDTAWPSGPATFYYGENFTGTLVADMQNKYSTLFLRQAFVVNNLAALASLELNAVCDDGFIAWINGVEVARNNAPAGEPRFNSFSAANIPEPVAYTIYPLPALNTFLVPGTNLLAVQVFNTALTSSDIVFDAELDAIARDNVGPAVVKISPAPGDIGSLTQITVTFSEPVLGIDASDLMLNSDVAESVTGAGATYTFSFPQPEFGFVQISWNPMHGITDMANPPNAFAGTGADATWSYHLIDPDAPTVQALHPPAGLTVRQLARIEMQFTEPVGGVTATDLLVNGVPATNVTGVADGPYVFEFPSVSNGLVQVAWAAGHGITDLSVSSNRFAGGAWQYTVAPAASAGDVIINEFVAENINGLKDEDGQAEDWIELFNRGTAAVDLAGWSLTDNPDEPGQWSFPAITLAPKQFLIVFASGKDRRPTAAGGRLHTNFKLNPSGEYLGLFSPDSPRQVVSEIAPAFPEQRIDYSFGRDSAGLWRYYQTPTPGAANGASNIDGVVAPVHFSVERGYFKLPFNLTLSTSTRGATIRYTFDGSEPTETNGTVYTEPIFMGSTRIVRAAAFKGNALPSEIATHTYLFNLPASQRALPVLSLVTATNNLVGRTGISGISGGTYASDGTWKVKNKTNDFYNPIKKGIAWERPVSIEFIRPEDNRGFQVECGIRIHASDYFRPRMHASDKFSYTLFFRSDYGAGRLVYPWFAPSVVNEFDEVVLRAGSNDPNNPFLRDQLIRSLSADLGAVASHGNFVSLFINGKYVKYYNPCERIEKRFCQEWHGGGGVWDVREQFGQMIDGNSTTWDAMMSIINARSFAAQTNYLEAARRIDLVNFIEYLLPLIYGDTGDWPENNWRAGRERVADGKWRFYIWDAEWSCGFNNPVTHNTLTSQLAGGSEIATIYKKLKVNPEFRVLFADRVHKHFFNGGALTDEKIRARYEELKTPLRGAIAGFDDTIGTAWIPKRRASLMNHLNAAGLIGSSNAPVFAQFGGRVPRGFALTMTTAATNGIIYFTTNGLDPRVPFTSQVVASAATYAAASPLVLDNATLVQARTLDGTNWSALTEATFQVAELRSPLRITEIMYDPPGDDAYEFMELQNTDAAPINLSGVTLQGVSFRFPEGATLAGGARLVLGSDVNPAAFTQRYPGVAVAGRFSGSLANHGERLTLLDRTGQTIVSVDYQDSAGWPAAAHGEGFSLEIIDPNGDPDDPANWQASAQAGGSAGAANVIPNLPSVRLNEVMAANVSSVKNGTKYSDWIELFNAGSNTVSLTDWSLSDDGDARKFVFPSGLNIPARGYLVVWCDAATDTPGLHSGFALNQSGESLFLFDDRTNRIDAVSFGLQLADLSIGRTDAADTWQLTRPTPGSENEAAPLAPSSGLVINEFMANPAPGDEDWIELFNADKNFPVALRGLHLSTSNALFQITSLSFVAPGGFAQLFADEKPGPAHLDFKLPASGGVIVLADEAGAEINRVSYGPQGENVSYGHLPDGDGAFVIFSNSASPGASNYQRTYAGAYLNEVLARNESLPDPATGRVIDWIEFYNPNDTVFDFSGMSLSVDKPSPGEWLFPAGTKLVARGYLVIRCDSLSPISFEPGADLNCGRSLAGESGGVFLFNAAGQLVDSVEYGFQIVDQSIGRDGGDWNLLTTPTPGTKNSAAAALGASANLRLNEWLANPASGDDWFEIFNLDALPVRLGNLFLSDDPSIHGQTNFSIAPLSFVSPHGWVKFEADGQPEQGRHHTPFRLDEHGGTLRLYDTIFRVIDSIDFSAQSPGISEGRFPDGTANIVRFSGTASPGAANYLPLTNVVINEVLTHTDPPLEDAIELFNTTLQPLDMGGWFLSNTVDNFKKFRIPNGTTIPARGYKVFYEFEFNPSPGLATSFTLNSAHGDEVNLSSADVSGNLTGFRARQIFGAAENSVSFGRHQTSVGEDFAALEQKTFGADAPVTLAQFRTGTGLPNARPRVGPLVINEVMYHPVNFINGVAKQEANEEFIEIQNVSVGTVTLSDTLHPTNRWRLHGAVDFEFPTGLTLNAASYALVVSFDPTTNVAALVAFRAKYSPPADTQIFGPFRGRLSDQGERLELFKPDSPQLPPHPDAGFVPYILVDHLEYSPANPWPVAADGAGASLQRKVSTDYGNDPVNWQASAPTAGRANAAMVIDADADGLPDAWEIVHGLDLNDARDAAHDEDDDGLNNFQEYLAGTDPFDPSSVLSLSIARLPTGKPRLTFAAAAGKSYSVQFRGDLNTGVWEKLFDIEAPATPSVIEREDTALIGTSVRFYRLVTPRAP